MTDHSPALPERTPADPRLTAAQDDALRAWGDAYARHIRSNAPPDLHRLGIAYAALASCINAELAELQAALSRAEADGERLIAGVLAILAKHRRSIELSPGVGESRQQYTIATIEDVENDLTALFRDAARSSAVRPPTLTED